MDVDLKLVAGFLPLLSNAHVACAGGRSQLFGPEVFIRVSAKKVFVCGELVLSITTAAYYIMCIVREQNNRI